MQHILRLAIVDPSDNSRNALKNLLLGMDRIWLEAECSRYEFFADVVAQTKPEIGMIVLDSDPEKGLNLVQRLHDDAPETCILVVSSTTDGNAILRAMRAGAKEFLPAPLKIDDLVAALERISTARFGRGESKTRSSTCIAICGATGGVGSTSLAVNLGCALARNPQLSVALVDLDLCLGDADVFLDTIPDTTLVDVAQNVTRLDFTLLKRSLTKHSSGLFLLPRPVQMQDAALVTPEDLQRVIGLMRATFTHVILDLSKSYSAIDRVALETSDHILLVTQLDLPCLRNVVRLMVSLGEMPGVSEKVKVVVNRFGLDMGQISLKKAQDTIGREIYWQLPNDYRTMSDVRNNGVPLVEFAPKAKITQSVVQLADAISGVEKPAASDPETGIASISRLLNFWSSRPTAPGEAS